MMVYKRGEIWRVDLNPVIGSEQAGIRPVILIQEEVISKYSSTIIVIPLTTNIRRSILPTCVLVPKNKAIGLENDSVAICHQIRAIDKTRFVIKNGELSKEIISEIENCLLYTLGIKI
jgi:mRNA interferase MazF